MNNNILIIVLLCIIAIVALTISYCNNPTVIGTVGAFALMAVCIVFGLHIDSDRHKEEPKQKEGSE